MKLQLNEKQKALHDRAVSLASQATKMEFARIENLIEIEANNVHKAFGKKMFGYATEVLDMDPGQAYPYIAIARSCVKYPQLRRALREGKLSVSKAGRIVSCLNNDNAIELIEFAKTHSKREIEEEISKRNPQAGTRDRVRSLNAEYDELKVRLPKEVSKKLNRVRALNPSCDLAKTVETMIEFYLDHKDPVRKAERAKIRAAGDAKTDKQAQTLKPQSNISNQNFGPGRKRQPLTAEQKHAVHQRDGGCCTFIGIDGKRCDSDRWVEIHHINPVHLGGTNDPENLTTHCSFHHDLIHQLSLPIEGQVNWLR
jgi:hypothetical protein